MNKQESGGRFKKWNACQQPQWAFRLFQNALQNSKKKRLCKMLP
jgi:hypothetical protein